MSDQTSPCHDRESPLDEGEQTLTEVAALEADLYLELRRLRQSRVPRAVIGSVPAFHGRAIWWWRLMVTEWAWSSEVQERHKGDVLRGLRCAIKAFSNGELASFLRETASNGRNSSAA